LKNTFGLKFNRLGAGLPLFLFLGLFSSSFPTNLRAATTYDVGAGQPILTLASLPVLQPGDVVNIHCGVYNEVRIWSASGAAGSPITLRGVCASGRPVIDGSGLDTSGNGGPRADWEIQGQYYNIENLEFTNARNGANGAGLRVMNANVTVTNCKMDNNDMGIMTSTTNVDNLLVQNTEIAYNGDGSDQSHNVYVTAGNTVTFAYCYIHDSTSGENVKSRAHYTQLFYNYIAFGAESEVEGLDGAATVDPNSNMTMIGNILVSTPNRTVNTTKFVIFGQDIGGAHNGTLYLINNTLIAGSSSIGFLRSSASNSAIVAANNVFYGSDTIVQAGWTTNVSGSNNWMSNTASIPGGFSQTVTGTLPGFVDAASYNYQLTAASPLRDIGLAAPVYVDGNGVSHSAIPTFSYVHPLSSMPRASDGKLDAGAYEFSGTSTTVTSAPAGLSLVVDGAACTSPCNFQWTPNSTHTIGAANQAGATGVNYLFSSWSDGGAASHTVTAGANGGTYTAAFNTQYLLTTFANPSAGGSISPATTWANAGGVVAISATASTGYQFSGFGGALTGTTSPQNVTMNGPASVTANFTAAAGASTIVTSTPGGRSLTVDGAACTSPCTFQWAPSSTHTIAAATQGGATGVNYLFSSWSDGGAASHTVTAGANGGTYTAAFSTQYLLTTFANPSAGGSVSPATMWVNAGSVAAISATASTGYQFSSFGGALTGTTSPQNYTVNGPATVIANFAAASGTSNTVTSAPAGRSLVVDGAACTSPCTFQWAPSSTHTIAAATQGGATGVNYLFSSWSDGGAASHTVTAGANGGTYTAAFSTQYLLTTLASPAAGGSISPGTMWVSAGSVVGISATASTGYQFSGFGGALTGTTSPQNYTVNGPATVIANFAGASSTSNIVTSAPAGRSLVVDGAACTSPCTFQWTPSSTHTIAAATQGGATGVNYLFSSWSDGGAASHTVTAGANGGTYTAAFSTQYLLTTLASPAAGGSISPGTMWVSAGSVVGISATASTGYQFSGFGGALIATTSPQNYTVNAPALIVANFAIGSSSSGPAWYGVGGTWSSRKALTINHTQVSGSSAITGFPVLVSITDANLQAMAKTDGSDILFTAADGLTKLSHEVEQYNSATGQLTAWVTIPSLSPATDTGIFVYYGNPSASQQQNPAGVWDINFKGVWHFANGSNLADSSLGGNNGVGVLSPAAASGKVGGAVNLNGSGQAINVGQNSTLNVGGSFTVEAWVNPAALDSRFGLFTTRSGGNAGSWQVEIGNDGNGNGAVALTGTNNSVAETSAGLLSIGSWAHIVVTKNGSGDSVSIYVNGSPVSLVRHTGYSTLDNVSTKFIGEGASGNQFFVGGIDEVRLSNTARNPAWIATEYNNQNAPGTFVSVGAQQVHP